MGKNRRGNHQILTKQFLIIFWAQPYLSTSSGRTSFSQLLLMLLLLLALGALVTNKQKKPTHKKTSRKKESPQDSKVNWENTQRILGNAKKNPHLEKNRPRSEQVRKSRLNDRPRGRPWKFGDSRSPKFPPWKFCVHCWPNSWVPTIAAM